MFRVLGVCGLPDDVSRSELKPGERPESALCLQALTTGVKLLCVVHSHIDSVRLERSIAEILSVVLLHAVIVLPDHIHSRRSAIEPPLGTAILRRTAAASALRGHA